MTTTVKFISFILRMVRGAEAFFGYTYPDESTNHLWNTAIMVNNNNSNC